MRGSAGDTGYGCDYEDYSCASAAHGLIANVDGFVMPGDSNIAVSNEVMYL